MTERRHATAVAPSNIALAKYWGKSQRGDNLTAVPSLSLTLSGLQTTTSVTFDATFETDSLTIDDTPRREKPLARAVALLDRVREASGLKDRARVVSHNDFPTASGLASSASGFAALALAASSAAGLSLDPARLSSLARRSSASAARSCFGGFVALGAEADAAEPVAPPDHWDVALIVVETSSVEKTIGSGPGMLQTERTSPYYAAWLEHAPRLYEEIRSAVLLRDLELLGPAMEQSALAMHACMLAGRPSLLYWSAVTLSVIERVRALQRNGLNAFFTIDAGPHVKVFTLQAAAERVATACREVTGVVGVRVCTPGAGARLVENSEQQP